MPYERHDHAQFVCSSSLPEINSFAAATVEHPPHCYSVSVQGKMKFPSFKRPSSASVTRPSTSASSASISSSASTAKSVDPNNPQQDSRCGLGGWNGVGTGISKAGSRPTTGSSRPQTGSSGKVWENGVWENHGLGGWNGVSRQSKPQKKKETKTVSDKAVTEGEAVEALTIVEETNEEEAAQSPAKKEKKKKAEKKPEGSKVQVLTIGGESDEEEALPPPKKEKKKKVLTTSSSMKDVTVKSEGKVDMKELSKKSQSMKDLTSQMVVEDIESDGYSDSEIEGMKKVGFRQRIGANLGVGASTSGSQREEVTKPKAFANKRMSTTSCDSDWSVEELHQTIKDLQKTSN